jgi:uncharacterized protein
MLQTGLNYELLVEDALRSVVRSSLSIVQKVGLPGETHFYIGFSTIHKDVEIDDHLRAKHPENMTIVLQHQFADLIVGDDEFSVTLFFGGKPSPMIIPFEAVTSFNDPSVGFGLQFGIADEDVHEDISPSDDQPKQSNDDESGNSADVVSLDTFRKRPTK